MVAVGLPERNGFRQRRMHADQRVDGCRTQGIVPVKVHEHDPAILPARLLIAGAGSGVLSGGVAKLGRAAARTHDDGASLPGRLTARHIQIHQKVIDTTGRTLAHDKVGIGGHGQTRDDREQGDRHHHLDQREADRGDAN